jgi:hypothetical protein
MRPGSTVDAKVALILSDRLPSLLTWWVTS